MCIISYTILLPALRSSSDLSPKLTGRSSNNSLRSRVQRGIASTLLRYLLIPACLGREGVRDTGYPAGVLLFLAVGVRSKLESYLGETIAS